MGAKAKMLMLLVPVAAVLLLVSLASRTARPAAKDDFRDLQVERRVIPDEKNFRIVFEKAGALIPKGARCSEWWMLSRRSACGLWDSGVVSTALVQSAEARACIQAGLARCDGYAGRGERAEFLVCSDAEVRVLSNAWRLSFEEALFQGDAGGARDRLFEGLSILSQLLVAPSDFNDHSIFSAWFGQVIGACEKLVHHPGCEEEWLAELSERIPRQDAVRQAGVNMLKGQFWQCVNAVDTGDAAKMVFPLSGRSATAAETRLHRVDALATHRLLADAFRSHVAVLESGRTDAAYFAALYDFSTLFFAFELVKILVAPNAGGRSISGYYSMFARLNVEQVKAAENGIACVRAVVAAERYRRANGAYPETLDALVPKYLDAVPRDTFSGGAMRYSRERGLMWAVGQNTVDDGGSTLTDKGELGLFRFSRPKDALDMVFPVSAKAFEEAASQTRTWLKKRSDRGRG